MHIDLAIIVTLLIDWLAIQVVIVHGDSFSFAIPHDTNTLDYSPLYDSIPETIMEPGCELVFTISRERLFALILPVLEGFLNLAA